MSLLDMEYLNYFMHLHFDKNLQYKKFMRRRLIKKMYQLIIEYFMKSDLKHFDNNQDFINYKQQFLKN